MKKEPTTIHLRIPGATAFGEEDRLACGADMYGAVSTETYSKDVTCSACKTEFLRKRRMTR